MKRVFRAVAIAVAAVLVGAVEAQAAAAWTIQPTVSPGTNSVLKAVSCATANVCMAVGSYTDAQGDSRPLVERWQGGSWTRLPSPTVSGEQDSLYGASCPTTGQCMAVGAKYVQQNGYIVSWLPLVEQWDGARWHRMEVPIPANSYAGLSAVSCTSTTACMAVGAYSPSERTYPLAERWDGTAWTF